MIFLKNVDNDQKVCVSNDNKLMATWDQNTPKIIKFWKWDEKQQTFIVFGEHDLQSEFNCEIEAMVFIDDKTKFAFLVARKTSRFGPWSTRLHVNKFSKDIFMEETHNIEILHTYYYYFKTLIPSRDWKQWFCEYSHAKMGELVDAENGTCSRFYNILSIHEKTLYSIFDCEFLIKEYKANPIFNFIIIDKEGVEEKALTFVEARKDNELIFLRTLYNTYVCKQLPNGNLLKLFKSPTSDPFKRQIRSDLDDIYINQDLKIKVYNKKVQSLIVSLALNRNISMSTFQLVLENVYKQSKSMLLTNQVRTFALELFRIVRKH